MTGSMFASIAGLKAHMQKLTVIGNNVANVNTQGYKKQRTIFRDSIYSLYSGGSNGTEVTGGMNPSQLGFGSLVASIDLDMSSSSYNPGNPSDCALVGDGFFLVGNKDIAKTIDPNNTESFKSLTLSRLGDFYFGPDGYLVDGQGNAVYGFMNVSPGYVTDPDTGKQTPTISDQLVPIRLPHWERTMVDSGQVDENGDPIMTEKYVTCYARDTDENGEKCALYDDDRRTTGEGENEIATALDFAKFSSISIDQGSGCITGIREEGDEPVVIGYLAIGTVTNPNGVSHVDSSYYRCMEGAGELRIGMLGGANKELGLRNVNSYMAETGEGARPLASGSAITSNGTTKMMVGFLESSNVDLATEIAELITTQRGYQANTRIITVTDTMLEELVNMKR